jgi:D-alanyl-D-alanine carboxypeptidase
MSLRNVSPRRRLAVAGLLATATIAGFGWDAAEARAPARHPHPAAAAHKRIIHGPDYHPPYAAIVVDHNSGQVLHDENADAPRHPASLTKIMTLYLLFDQLEAGRLKLDTPLPVSALAAVQHPTKLGLKLHQLVPHVDDLVEPCSEQIARPRRCPLPRPHRKSSASPQATESRRAIQQNRGRPFCKETTLQSPETLPPLGELVITREQRAFDEAIRRSRPMRCVAPESQDKPDRLVAAMPTPPGLR